MSGDEVVEQDRETELYLHKLDPIARNVVAASDPWDAYREALTVSGQLLDDLEWLPHGGRIYVAWAQLADVYDTGKTPIPDAHSALRHAASAWLDRSGPPTREHIEKWLDQTENVVRSLFGQDGDFWHPPS